MIHLDYQSHLTEITKAIEKNVSIFKIILKTKNEKCYLKRWIDHHGGIVGIENLIIFDNGSSEDAVWEIYQTYPDLLVISTSMFHNDLHDRSRIPEFYDALCASCECFSFLDTDEFLVYFESENYLKNEDILPAIQRECKVGFIPTTWLYTAIGTEEIFQIKNRQTLLDGLRWGKPILPASVRLSGQIAHNIQLPERLPSSRGFSSFFLLHLAVANSTQRIRSNLQKLKSRGFIGPESQPEDVLSLDTKPNQSSNINLYIEEIKRLYPLSITSAFNAPEWGSVDSAILLKPDGSISYSDEIVRELLRSFLNNTQDFKGCLQA